MLTNTFWNIEEFENTIKYLGCSQMKNALCNTSSFFLFWILLLFISVSNFYEKFSSFFSFKFSSCVLWKCQSLCGCGGKWFFLLLFTNFNQKCNNKFEQPQFGKSSTYKFTKSWLCEKRLVITIDLLFSVYWFVR